MTTYLKSGLMAFIFVLNFTPSLFAQQHVLTIEHCAQSQGSAPQVFLEGPVNPPIPSPLPNAGDINKIWIHSNGSGQVKLGFASVVGTPQIIAPQAMPACVPLFFWTFVVSTPYYNLDGSLHATHLECWSDPSLHALQFPDGSLVYPLNSIAGCEGGSINF